MSGPFFWEEVQACSIDTAVYCMTRKGHHMMHEAEETEKSQKIRVPHKQASPLEETRAPSSYIILTAIYKKMLITKIKF